MKSNIAHQFSRAARSYTKEARVQATLEAQLASKINSLPCPKRVLDLGCGVGNLSALIASHWSEAEVDAVDVADQMIEAARNLHGQIPNIHWHCVDFRQAALAGNYDVVFSNASLQWLLPLEHTLSRINSLLTKNGRLLFTIFLDGSLQELNTARDLIAPRHTPITNLPTLSNVFASLNSAKFQISSAEYKTHTLDFDSAQSALSHLKKTGTTGTPSSVSAMSKQNSGINQSIRLTPRQLKALKNVYPKNAQGDGWKLHFAH